MTRHTATLYDEHADRLRSLTLPESGQEGAAYLLLRRARSVDPWTGVPTTRYLSREVIPVAREDLISSSGHHITVRTHTFARVLKRAADTDCAPAFVHGHPGGFDRFSGQDDAGEPGLVEMTQNRNGADSRLVSIVFTASGRLFGRVWLRPTLAAVLDSISIVGRIIRVHDTASDAADNGANPDTDPHNRQNLAFGASLTRSLAALRIGVIGCGATGSATAMLLARLGASRLLLVDRDTVATTNLNRLLGASPSDVGRPKVEVVRDMVNTIGLGGQVHTYQGWIGDLNARDLLKSCDVVFGCTDDHDGRLLLNRFAYFYLVPVIDTGIGIAVTPENAIIEANSRVTVVVPGSRCLLCRGAADPVLAREDDLMRRDPEEYAKRRAEGDAYIQGGGIPNPAVVTFTAGVACMAVDELIQRLSGYREPIDHRVFMHVMSDVKRPGPRGRSRGRPCPVCMTDDYLGLGDTARFLGRVG